MILDGFCILGAGIAGRSATGEFELCFIIFSDYKCPGMDNITENSSQRVAHCCETRGYYAKGMVLWFGIGLITIELNPNAFWTNCHEFLP